MGEISETYSGGTPKVSIKSFYNKKEIPFIRSSDIHKNTTELYITKEGLEESSAKLVSKGQILYALYGATSGEVDISKIDGAINQAILAINTHDNINYFIMLFLNKNKDKIIKKYIQGGQGNLSAKIVKNININITSKKEEKEISTFIKKFEKIFTLYENKRKLLTVLSQGLSQYLFNFSKEKSTIQMSLSSITLSEAKGIAKENTLSSGNIEYLDTTRLNGGKVKLVSGKKDVDFQDIIVLWDGSNAGKIYYGFSGILGSTLKVFKLKDDINSEYVYYYLKFKQNLILHKFRTPNIPHVSKDFSQRFNLPIPDKEKQNLIANILHLNELQVNLTNKKIKKLKQIKKSLLQNMFL